MNLYSHHILVSSLLRTILKSANDAKAEMSHDTSVQ
jgi:hypothetical protein